jgi:CDP-glycerol glycerophosphotransferase (TagB/SpsB family)
MGKIRKIFIESAVKLYRVFSFSSQKIVYHSFPDFSDNSFAIFVYICNNYKEYSNIWLVKDTALKHRYYNLAMNYTNNNNLLIVKKNSFLGVFHYLTANFVFHTHGIFNMFGLISTQKKISLWHGMPIKNIGYLIEPKKKGVLISDYHISTSVFFQNIISKAFKTPLDSVLIVGQTRYDFLVESEISINHLFGSSKKYKKTILWMPTYRKSVIGEIRIDGEVNPDIDFLSAKSLSKINQILIKTESICYVKLHPMDYLQVEDFKSYSNFVFIDNDSFIDKGIALYSVFNSVDILLTDFSSIYIDFLLLNKPIGFIFSDYEEFKNSRGFVFSDAKKYMPGGIITSIAKLEFFLNEVILKNNDNYIKEREEIKSIFHIYEKDFSKKLLDKVL